MQNSQQNNKRIAKNTLLLYFRMLLTMGVSLYTSRVVLDKLGITDYGIYNVVGGIVTMLGFLNGSMANAVQRFISFEIGQDNDERVNRVFNVALFAHYCLALIVFVIVELLGVWYLNNYLNIPHERIDAANWVLQCSIITMLFTIVQVPYNAIIIAKEQMGIYAYLSILEVILKLLIVYILVLGEDKLKLYSVLVMIVSIFMMMVYKAYCRRKYTETRYRRIKDKTLFKQLIGFASWNMLGEIAWVFTGQGVNIILNAFYGPAVNAARGLAEQVNGAVNRFVSNFQTAVNPQLVKTYAADQLDEMKKLLYRSTRFSFYLLLALSLPLIINMGYVLNLWLKDVPEYTIGFCQLVLVCSLVSTISNLLAQVARAYGKIRKYQIVVSFTLFMNFPISYFVLKLGASPLATMLVNIIIQAILIYIRLVLVRGMINMPTIDFFKNVIVQIVSVSACSVILPLTVWVYSEDTFVSFVVVSCTAIISVCVVSYFIGMSKYERQYINKVFQNALHKVVSR